MLTAVARVALLACSLALDVFAVSVGVGMRGLEPGARVRIGLSFASAEILMNLIGAGLGLVVGHVLGDAAGYLGYFALVVVGGWMLGEELRQRKRSFDLSRGWGLFIASISISLDSLGVGFSIVYVGAPLPVTLVAIGAASLAATTLGLTFGRHLGARAERWAGIVGGLMLVATGVAFALLKYTGRG